MRIGDLWRRDGPRVSKEPTGACGAPHASMYFAPDGQVRACCVNTSYTLGRIGPQSIREVWDGARLAALRAALDRHDYSLGCRDCEHRVAAGDRQWSTAAQYDPYLADDPGEFPRRMDFILSITCNLQCAMCDGELSSSIRLHREKRAPLPPAYGDGFFDELGEFLPHLERSVFLGGEPFVAREPQRVFDLMIDQGHTAEVQVVTNGTQWNPRVERYLRELPMNVTVSIDGLSAETLEPLRVGVDRDRLFANVGRYQEAVASHGGTVSFHYCLMRQNWHEFGAFLLEADRRGIHVIVMTVTGPAGFSLWDLPEADLRRVLAALDREGEQVALKLGRNRGVWDAELDRIRRHLEVIEAGETPVWVTSSWEPAPEPSHQDGAPATAGSLDAGRRVIEAEGALADWSGQPPLLLTVRGGQVASVDRPGWAASLDLDRWLGRTLPELAELVAGDLGAASEPSVVAHADGVVQADTDFGKDSEPLRVRSFAIPADASGDLVVLMAVDRALSHAPAIT